MAMAATDRADAALNTPIRVLVTEHVTCSMSTKNRQLYAQQPQRADAALNTPIRVLVTEHVTCGMSMMMMWGLMSSDIGLTY